jgi:hypothetical protein
MIGSGTLLTSLFQDPSSRRLLSMTVGVIWGCVPLLISLFQDPSSRWLLRMTKGELGEAGVSLQACFKILRSFAPQDDNGGDRLQSITHSYCNPLHSLFVMKALVYQLPRFADWVLTKLMPISIIDLSLFLIENNVGRACG